MSSAGAHDESRDQIDETLNRRVGELDPAARKVRAALLRGESLESLELTEDGLAKVLRERGIG